MSKAGCLTVGSLVWLGVITAPHSAAQTPPTTSADVETITITASRAPASTLSSSASIGVVDAEQLDIISHTHINEAMFQIPGTWISRGNGQEHLTAVRSPVLTGAGACGAFYMAQDGISLRGPALCNTNQLFDSHSEQAQQVEVLRGPGSVAWGSNAVHGVINLVTPSPLTAPDTSTSIEGGPNDFFRHNLAWSSSSDNRATGLYSTLTHDGGYKDDSGYDQQKVSLIHQHQHGDWQFKHVLSATNLNQETAGFVRGENAFADPLLKRQNPNPEAYRDSKSARFYSVIDLTLDKGRSLNITPYLRWTDMEFLQHFLPWQSTEQNRQRGAGIKSAYTVSDTDSELTLGFDVDFSRGNLVEFQDDPFAPTIPQGDHYDYQVDIGQYSPFAMFTYQMTPSFSINGGLRYEYMHFDYTNQLSDGSACAIGIENCRFYRPASQTRSFSNLSGQLGITYAFSSGHRGYIQISNGHRVPQATELFRLQAGQQIADLESEQMRSTEIGLKGVSPLMSYNVALFSMEKSDVIFQDTQRQNISDGSTTHRGIEVRLRRQMSESVYWSFSGTLANHRYDAPLTLSRINIEGNEIDTAPQHIASTQLGWKSDTGARVEMEYVHLGNYFLDPENTAEYKGHNLLNLRTHWPINDQLQLTARVMNLLDQDYAERADFAFGSYRYFVGEPRSVFVGAQYRW